MKIKSQTDFWAGVMYIVVGAAFAGFAAEYDYGTPQRMGPAFFPTMLGGLLAVIGVIVAMRGLTAEDPHGQNKIERISYWAVGWVIGAVVVYGLLLRPLGIIVTNALLVIIAMYASHEFKWKEAVALAVVMGIIVYAVFVYALSLTVPVLPAFMSN